MVHFESIEEATGGDLMQLCKCLGIANGTCNCTKRFEVANVKQAIFVYKDYIETVHQMFLSF